MAEENLTELQLDALKEIGTIGAGNAATGISKMLGRKIDITVPRVNMVALEKVPEMLGGSETLVTAIYFQVTGDISGTVLFMFPIRESLKMADLLVGKTLGQTRTLDDFSQSALKELGNISTASYLMALSGVIKMKLFHSVPGLVTDMLGAVLDGILIKLSLEVEHAVIVETEFTVGEKMVKGHLLFLPDPDGLKAIIEALGV